MCFPGNKVVSSAGEYILSACVCLCASMCVCVQTAVKKQHKENRKKHLV